MEDATIKLIDRYGIIVITVVVVGCLIWILKHIFTIALPSLMENFDRQIKKMLDMFDKQINLERATCQAQHSISIRKLDSILSRIQISDDIVLQRLQEICESGEERYQSYCQALTVIHGDLSEIKNRLEQLQTNLRGELHGK